MICNNCGKFNPDTESVCSDCGKPMEPFSGTFIVPPYSPLPAQQDYAPRYQRKNSHIPSPAYKPLSPWAYFGYQLLFSIPLVGFILLIVFSCGGTSNVNLKNFVRSYWCGFAVLLILVALVALAVAATGGLTSLLGCLPQYR